MVRQWVSAGKAVPDADDLVDRRSSKVRKFGRSCCVPSAVLKMRLLWVKGEVFRETFGSLTIIKVRKYRTKVAATGRKSPADVAKSVRASAGQKLNGEIFQDRGGCDQKCSDFIEMGVEVRVFGRSRSLSRIIENVKH